MSSIPVSIGLKCVERTHTAAKAFLGFSAPITEMKLSASDLIRRVSQFVGSEWQRFCDVCQIIFLMHFTCVRCGQSR